MAASGELLCISYHKQQRQTPLRAPFPQVLLGFSFMKVSGKHFCKAAEQNHSDLPALFFFFFFALHENISQVQSSVLYPFAV